MGNIHGAQAPIGADFLKGQVAIVAECHVGQLQPGIEGDGVTVGQQTGGEHLVDALLGVRIHDIVGVPGGGQQVLVAVQIDIHGDGRPGPFGGMQSAVAGNFGVGAVAPVQEKGIAHNLWPIVDFADAQGSGLHVAHLGLAALVVPAQHIGEEEIEMAVPVRINKCHRHTGLTGVSQCQAPDGLEIALAVVDPDTVRAGEIVADVDVGIAIPIHILEPGSQAPILEGRHWIAVFIEESLPGHCDLLEAATAVVEVEMVRLCVFMPAQNSAVDLQRIVVPEFGCDGIAITGLHHQFLESGLPWPVDVPDAPTLVVGDIEIEVTVPINIGQCGGGAAVAGSGREAAGQFGKAAGAIVEQEGVRSSQGGDQQVEIPVTIYVGQHGAGGKAVIQGDTCLGRNIGEGPVAQVTVEDIRAVQTRKIDVGPTVAIHIADGHAGAV